jgi:glycosyltransferase involved in cell wall biosynthesis
MPPRRLLTVAHSYVVALNRRLAEEMARVDPSRWEVVAVAPRVMHGDLRRVSLEPGDPTACRVEGVPVSLSKFIHLMRYGRQLKRLMRGERWDLIHAWEEPYIYAGWQLARWAPREARLVYATFQNIAKRYPPPFGWFERAALRRADGWVAFGRTVEETLQTRPGYSARPHQVIPPGVDTLAFRPDPDLGRATRTALGWSALGPPVVGYLGRFVPEKGLPMLTAALDAVRSPWRALFVGGGPLEAPMREWGKRHPDRVRVVTGVPHARVPDYLNAMDVLAAPSQTTPRWREQFGRMLVEAFACGVPVLGSDSGEIPHVIGDAGVGVGEADRDGWVNALGRLIDSPAERAELSRRGRERAEAHFAWPVVARRHLAFFDELMAHRHSAPTPVA